MRLCIKQVAFWFGWSGKFGEMASAPNIFEMEGVTYAAVDLTRADHDGGHSGFSNAADRFFLHTPFLSLAAPATATR